MKIDQTFTSPMIVNCTYTGTNLVDAWSRNHGRTLPVTAVNLGVSSSHMNDSATGTGARTVVVSGLDGNYNPVTETLSLNGQTKVTSTKQFLRVNKIYVTSAGSGRTNAGVLYVYDTASPVTNGVPQDADKLFGVVDAGRSVSTMGMFTVPAGRRVRVTRIAMDVWHTNTTAQYWCIQVKIRRGSVEYAYYIGGPDSQSGRYWVDFTEEGIELQGGDEFVLQVQSSTTTQANFIGFIYVESE